MEIFPASSFRGTFRVPGDKSISHRLAILAALAEGRSRLLGFSPAADCLSTLSCLEALGVEVELSQTSTGPRVEIEGRGFEGLGQPRSPLDCGNSGTTLRLLSGVLAGRPFGSTLTGDPSLRRRPMQRVAEPLRAMGADIWLADGGRPPVSILGASLRPIDWRPDVPSAQVKTAVLLAGLQAAGLTTVRETVPTRDHTERWLPLFGASLTRAEGEVSVRGPARLSPLSCHVPGDASSAAFLLIAALLLPGSEVKLEQVLLNPSRAAFLRVLREMGAGLEWRVEAESPEPVGWIRARSSELRARDLDPAELPSVIDEVPALAVALALANGTSRVRGAAELRVKESDRLQALAEGLTRMGAAVEERPDGLVISGPCRLRGATVRSFGDHRIAMALAVAALTAEGPTRIEGASCVSISFPGFFELLAQGAGRP